MRYLVGFLAFALVVSIFAVLNSQLVTIQLFFWPLELPLVYVILGTALVGLLAGILLGSISRRKTPKSYLQADGTSRFNNRIHSWKR